MSKVSSIVNQMRSYGEEVSDEKIESKVLRSLHKDFRHVVPAIEESKDLSSYTVEQLMCSLMKHEERIRGYGDNKTEEQLFQV